MGNGQYPSISIACRQSWLTIGRLLRDGYGKLFGRVALISCGDESCGDEILEEGAKRRHGLVCGLRIGFRSSNHEETP